MEEDHAEDLLRRALIDAEAAASVALRVAPLTLTDTLTVVFHGRRDLGTIQTYIANGGRGAGGAVGRDELTRGPRGPDLAGAQGRAPAEHPVPAEGAAPRA